LRRATRPGARRTLPGIFTGLITSTNTRRARRNFALENIQAHICLRWAFRLENVFAHIHVLLTTIPGSRTETLADAIPKETPENQRSH
jgi:hypothetical protein